jgi:hypothetical protein
MSFNTQPNDTNQNDNQHNNDRYFIVFCHSTVLMNVI